MESNRKRTPDYTDIAYREAVSRLRYLLAESYSPHATPSHTAKLPHVHNSRGDDSDNETVISAVSDRSRHTHRPLFGSKRNLYTDSAGRTPVHTSLTVPSGDGESTQKAENSLPPQELMSFIERQEEYIEQLEKESQYCREELGALLGKVKDVISENEGLHEREKAGLLRSVLDNYGSGDEDSGERQEDSKRRPLEGPSIVFESRISELEAQLTQTRVELRTAREEADSLRRRLAEGESATSATVLSDVSRHQIDTLQREKTELNETVSRLQAVLRDRDTEAAGKVKRSLDLAEQAQFEKAQAEMEVRRLKDELDRQHEKLRELLQDQGRRLQEERSQAERRYGQQLEVLGTDLASQFDTAAKLQLELERQRRVEADLRRELQQRCASIEELKKELAAKTVGLQSEVSQASAERSSIEQELASCRLAAERAERDARQEISRLSAEVAALRGRLDRADADLMHSRRENLRLSEQVSSLERELNMAKMLRDSSDKSNGPLSPSKLSGQREKELTSMIMDMESKHVETVAELEGMIQSQNQVMEKLKEECHTLTERLEESSARHKEERSYLRKENAILLDKLEQLWINCKDLRCQAPQETTHMLPSSSPIQTCINTMETSSPTKIYPSEMKRHPDLIQAVQDSSLCLQTIHMEHMSPTQTWVRNLSMSKHSSPGHRPLQHWRPLESAPLTLEDLATDSDSNDSPSTQLATHS